jgi:hypothetical protein
MNGEHYEAAMAGSDGGKASVLEWRVPGSVVYVPCVASIAPYGTE